MNDDFQFLNKYFGLFFKALNSGNVSIITAASIFVLILAVGGALDFHNYSRIYQLMADANDAAALVAANKVGQSLTGAETAALRTFNLNVRDYPVVTSASHELTVNKESNSTAVTYNSRYPLKTIFLGLIGINEIKINVSSKVKTESNPFEMMFVLDTTGSMNINDRIGYLKSSVSTILSKISNVYSADNRIKIGMLSFHTQVRIPPSVNYQYVDYSQCYLRPINYYACLTVLKNYDALCAQVGKSLCYTARSQASYRVYVENGQTKFASRLTAYALNGSAYILYTFDLITTVDSQTSRMSVVDSQFSSRQSNKPPLLTQGYNAFSENYFSRLDDGKWNGCLTDRNQPYDAAGLPFDDDVPASYYIAANCNDNQQANVLDLTSDINQAQSYLKTLTPGGATNITLGLQMGLEVLSPEMPYTHGASFKDKDVKKYMVLVTDGENTQNRWTSKTRDIDKRTHLMCEAVKEAGVTLFVVKVEDGNSALLEECASRPDYFYNLQRSAQLNEAMNDIFKTINKLRLVQ